MPTRQETRVVSDGFDLSAYKWRIETDGLRLLINGFKDKKFLGRKCHKCGTVYIPGPTYCRKCFIDIDEVVEVPPKGRIATFTVNLADIRGNPVEEITIACNVRLEGSESWLMGQLKGWDDWKKVHVGMPVKAIFKEETKGALADIEHFEPV